MPISPNHGMSDVFSSDVMNGTGTFIPMRLPITVCGRVVTAMNVKTFITLFKSLL